MNKHPECKQEQLEAENKELLSQNKWLKAQIESIAGQHAPLEPIPDQEGWSRKLPGYDLVSLLRDAERYRFLRERDLETIKNGGVFAGKTPDNVVINGNDLDAAIDAARHQISQAALEAQRSQTNKKDAAQ